jgi:hypothetical protein
MRKQKPSSNKRWHGGKGSRPRSVDSEKFSEAFDRIFSDGPKEKKQNGG